MKKLNLRGVTPATWVRLAALILALCNQVLAIFGREALPIYEETLTQIVTVGLTLCASFAAWWKNNSFTAPAQAADGYKEELKLSEKEDGKK